MKYIMIIIIVLTIFSCNKKNNNETSSKSNNKDNINITKEAEIPPVSTPKMADNPDDSDNQVKKPSKPIDPIVISKKTSKTTETSTNIPKKNRDSNKISSFYTILNTNDVYPEDVDIGILYHPLDESDEVINANLFIEEFFKSFLNKSINYNVISKDMKTLLKRRVVIPENVDILEYRLGKIYSFNNKDFWCNFKLLSKKGYTIGEIYLNKVETQFQITDIQIDMEELKLTKEKEEIFEPSLYSWIESL